VLAPGFIARGLGCHVWDADGNEFIEYGMGLRAVGALEDGPEAYLVGRPVQPVFGKRSKSVSPASVLRKVRAHSKPRKRQEIVVTQLPNLASRNDRTLRVD
jgi:hypothetical protein